MPISDAARNEIKKAVPNPLTEAELENLPSDHGQLRSEFLISREEINRRHGRTFSSGSRLSWFKAFFGR